MSGVSMIPNPSGFLFTPHTCADIDKSVGVYVYVCLLSSNATKKEPKKQQQTRVAAIE